LFVAASCEENYFGRKVSNHFFGDTIDLQDATLPDLKNELDSVEAEVLFESLYTRIKNRADVVILLRQHIEYQYEPNACEPIQ